MVRREKDRVYREKDLVSITWLHVPSSRSLLTGTCVSRDSVNVLDHLAFSVSGVLWGPQVSTVARTGVDMLSENDPLGFLRVV